jgi:hypothetical protein
VIAAGDTSEVSRAGSRQGLAGREAATVLASLARSDIPPERQQ